MNVRPWHQRHNTEPRVIPETMTQAGAERLKQIIEDYWALRGCKVAVWLEKSSGGGYYFVRSNLVNGAPQRVA